MWRDETILQLYLINHYSFIWIVFVSFWEHIARLMRRRKRRRQLDDDLVVFGWDAALGRSMIVNLALVVDRVFKLLTVGTLRDKRVWKGHWKGLILSTHSMLMAYFMRKIGLIRVASSLLCHPLSWLFDLELGRCFVPVRCFLWFAEYEISSLQQLLIIIVVIYVFIRIRVIVSYALVIYTRIPIHKCPYITYRGHYYWFWLGMKSSAKISHRWMPRCFTGLFTYEEEARSSFY